MDRDRLQQVQQTELTEGRINEEFLDWLKNKGPIWLSVIMLGLAGYLGVLKWRQARQQRIETAWEVFADVQQSDPQTIEEIATDEAYSGVFAVPQLARARAADRYLSAVQLDRPVVPDASGEAASLTPEQRREYLEQADRLYRELLAEDDGSLRMTLHAVGALNGRAAVAETRGDVESARQLYEQAAQRAETFYPVLAAQARQRGESVERYSDRLVLPSRADLPPPPAPEAAEPVTIADSLRELLPPELAADS